MKYFICFLFLLSYLESYSQEKEVVSLLNQVAKDEVPTVYKFYYLMAESLPELKFKDSITNFQKTKILVRDPDFPLDFLYKQDKHTVNWSEFEIKKVKFIKKENGFSRPKSTKEVIFVDQNIAPIQLDSLKAKRKPYTLIIKRNKRWNKEEKWKQIEKSWEEDEIEHREEKKIFAFSYPIFTTDKKYARISIFERTRCRGSGNISLYRKEDGIWKRLIKHDSDFIEVVAGIHSSCGDVKISFKN